MPPVECIVSVVVPVHVMAQLITITYIHTHTNIIHSEGIRPPPEITTVPYSSVVNTLKTGDLVLFSGATSSGAIIKFFDNSQFSHVGLVCVYSISDVVVC